MKSLAQKLFKNRLSDSTIIYIAFVSVFLHFVITGAVIVFLGIYIFLKYKNDRLFEYRGAKLIITFAVYTVIVALFNQNYIGIGCSLLFVFLMEIFLFVRKHITPHIFERALEICCYLGASVGILCMLDFVITYIIQRQIAGYRTTLYFFNCNYLATVLATVIIICGYKVLAQKGPMLLYCVCAVFSFIGAYLTGSMFVLVEIFFGAAFLMFFMRKGQILAALLLMCGTALIVLYCLPDILPRLNQANITTDNRVTIWKTTLEAIKQNPIFGGGFLTYFNVQDNFKGSYYTTHAHNLVLESILSFGVIGSVVLGSFFVLFFRRVFICKNAQSKYYCSSLILALTIALLAHSTTDLTFLWVQTGLFFCLMLGTIGCEEKMLKID